MAIKTGLLSRIKDREYRFNLLISFSLLTVVLVLFSMFLNFVESRPGMILNDPLLNSFEAIDLTWPTFTMIYGAILVAIYFLSMQPDNLIIALRVYLLMILFRAAAMYLLPLEPPEGMIALKDPFVELFGSGQTLTKDLFFSGHTATMFLFFLVIQGRAKVLFLLLTLLIAVSVLLQKVHYSIDVIGAFLFTYTAYRIVVWNRTEKK